MGPEIIDYLHERRISCFRLADESRGAIGITLNPHFILDRRGARTGWLAKRLRSCRFADPEATFARFQREHEMIERFFGAQPDAPSMVARTRFVILDFNLDAHPDYTPGREYVMVQEYVEGVSLDVAAGHFRGEVPAWLGSLLLRFVGAYREMQTTARAVLDCFSTGSDHIKIDLARRRLLLIDTNNPVCLSERLPRCRAFLERFEGAPASATSDDLQDVFDRMGRSGEFDPRRLSSTRDATFLRDARAVELLARYFPRRGTDNQYLREVAEAFGLPTRR